MRKAARFLALTAGLAAFAAACGSDDDPTGTNSGDPLTTQEALDVYAQLNTAVAQALGNLGGPAASPGASFEDLPTVSADCPEGGSVSVSGSYDASNYGANGGNISFDFTENINSCGIVSGGHVFTVDGDPSITISGDIDITIDGMNYDLSGTYDLSGGFSYDSDDGRSGSCAMNVSVNYGTFQVSGSICGQSLGGS